MTSGLKLICGWPGMRRFSWPAILRNGWPIDFRIRHPGHRIQIDVKFLSFTNKKGKEVKRYQYTAIDDATRARALRIYDRHSQKHAIDFVDYVLSKFPFRVQPIQTDNGHEFQGLFHWHCEDLGIRHIYIKKASPHLNGKVELSHLTDHQEFYQLIEYTDDIDIAKKLKEWETFYNRQL